MMKIKASSKIIICGLIFSFALLCLSGCQDHNSSKPKLLLIGLDGATWNVMHPLIDQGRLPNIKRLIDQGCWGRLKSFAPLISEVIWTSIATGKPPEMHGIDSQYMTDPHTGLSSYVTTNLRKTKAIWNILSENNRRVGMINYLVTRPPEKINGVMIGGRYPGMNYISYSAKTSYPDFREICSPGQFESFRRIGKSVFSGVPKQKFPGFWWTIEDIDNFMINFSQYLLQNQDFDFFCLYLRGTDEVSHRFWQYLFPEPGDSSNEAIAGSKEVINDYYIWADKAIGELSQAAGKNAAIIIASDHGFQAKTEEWYFLSKFDYFLQVCDINKIRKDGKKVIFKNDPPDNDASFLKNIKIIAGLSPEEFNAVREEAKNFMGGLRYKETNEPVFSKLEDSRSGFVVKLNTIEPQHHILINAKEYSMSDFLKRVSNTGGHAEYGVLVISGKNISRNKIIEDATIYDIVPSILYYSGLPVAKDMKGKVLLEAFNGNFTKRHPVQYIDTYETGARDMPKNSGYSASEEDAIKDRLRSLGYIR